LPFNYGLILWKGRCVAEGRFAELVRLEGLSSIFTSLGIIAAVSILPGSYVAPLLVFFLAPSWRNVLTTLSDLKAIPKSGDVENEIIEYGIRTSIYSGVALLAERLDGVFLFFFLSPTAVALFAAADRLAELFRSITRDIASAIAPRLVKANYTDRLDHAFRLYALAMGGALVFFAFAILPLVFTLIFTRQYDAAIPYAQALVCSVAIGNLAAMRFRYIRSRMDAVSYRNVMLVSAVAKLGSLALLVPLFGLAGAVASAFVYRVAMLGAVHFAMRKFYSRNVRS
jgi:O-antigen/teichoic acid export membrane protein